MSKSPKYTYRVVEKRNKTWTAEIQRQATARKKIVSKRQAGFETEAQGIEWAEQELVSILENHKAKNQRQNEQRLASYQQKQAEVAQAAESAEVSDVAEEEQVDLSAKASSTETASQADDDSELVGKPMFDFEMALEQEEVEEKPKKVKRKHLKKAEQESVQEAKDVEPDPSQTTVDGSDEVNDIYLKK